MTGNISERCDSLGNLLPGYPPINGVIQTDTVWYTPVSLNGGAYVSGSSVLKKVSGAIFTDGTWVFINNETKYAGTLNDPSPYNIQILNSSTWKIYKIVPDGSIVGIWWRITKTYTPKST